MKKLYGRLFLVIMLFSTVGYYGLLLLLREQHSRQLVQRLDEKADEIGGQLILRIPLATADTHDDPEYIRMQGETIYQGQVYYFIKRRIYHDTLYLVCLKSQEGTKIYRAMADYSKTFAGELPESARGRKAVASSGEYCIPSPLSGRPWQPGWNRVLLHKDVSSLYCFNRTVSVFHPPNRPACC